MAIFKYFSSQTHALALVTKGEMRLQPLAYFRGIEDDGIRGDPNDGILTYAPQGGLIMNMDDGRTITVEGGTFNSSVNHSSIYVYCASNQLSDKLAAKFGSFCVEIPAPEIITRRLKLRSHPTSKIDYEQIVFGKVEYRDHLKEPGSDWALPERLVLIKPKVFEWQDEFRIAVGTRGTLDVENVGLTIQTGPSSFSIEPTPSPIVLRLGSLTGYLTLHRF